MVEPTSRKNTTLQVGAVHAMENSKADFGLFVIPTPAGDGTGTCTLISWKDEKKVPKMLAKIYDNSITEKEKEKEKGNEMETQQLFAEIREEIADKYPRFGEPSEQALSQLLQQRPSEASLYSTGER